MFQRGVLKKKQLYKLQSLRDQGDYNAIHESGNLGKQKFI